jgi:quinol monooxygenase YgiN
MSVIVIVAYRPRPGKEALLLQLTKEHVTILREQGLATERVPYAMRSADGTIIEVFEWKSKEAIEAAHTNPAVL